MNRAERRIDVVVVGAGAVGCSIAYQLTRRGKTVALLDRRHPGAGTSSFNFGLVWVQSKEPLTYMELSLTSSLLMKAMVEELGDDVELRQGGGVTACLTEEAYVAAGARIARQQCSPRFEGRMLTPEELHEMQPGISADTVGASWSPHDGDVDWVKWTRSLARACEHSGVNVRSRTEVQGLEAARDGEGWIVHTDRGRVEARCVVNAAGPWAKRIAAMVGVEIDLYPLRGQILVSAPTKIVCPTPMSTVRQDRNGRFILGTTWEDVGFDWSTTEEAARAIRKQASHLVPAVRDLEIEWQFSGLRPQPRDGLPILGAVDRLPGYFIAVSHSGITLSPVHGKVISDLIVDRATEIPIAAYDPLRFEKARGLKAEREAGSPRVRPPPDGRR